MADQYDALNSLLSHSNKSIGKFSSYIYTLHFEDEFDPDSSLEWLSRADSNLYSDEKRLGHALTFLHEMNHLSTYLSSSFGMSSFISLESALVSLIRFREEKLSLPISYLEDGNSSAFKMYELFQHYFMDELGAPYRKSFSNLDRVEAIPTSYTSVYSEPVVPPALRQYAEYFANAPDAPTGIAGKLFWATGDYIFMTLSNPSNVIAEDRAIYYSKHTGKEVDVRINATTLMEALAVISEIRLISESIDYDDIDDLVRLFIKKTDDIYTVVFNIFLDFTKFKPIEILYTLPAIIDLALMQDSLSLTGYGPFEKNEQPYKSPSHYFFLAIGIVSEHGGLNELFQKYRPKTRARLLQMAQKYQDDIAVKMEVNKAQNCAEIVIRRLIHHAPHGMFSISSSDVLRISKSKVKNITYNNSVFFEAGTVDYRIPLILHFTMLQVRLNNNGFFLSSSSLPFQSQIFKMCGEMISVVNIDDKKFKPNSMFNIATLFAVPLVEFFNSAPSKDCPFKLGNPFFCHSEGDSACARFVDGKEPCIQACPFYLMGQIFSEPPGRQDIIDLTAELNIFEKGGKFVFCSLSMRNKSFVGTSEEWDAASRDNEDPILADFFDGPET